MSAYRSIEWREGVIRLLDQRRLPRETKYLDYTDYREVATAIREMVIRGAPAIGAAYGLALAADVLRAARPPSTCSGRLTAWELQQLGIPHTVVVDGASGHFMRTQGVDLCLVGCDRVAANGDTANRIGTYNLALAAHDVPFYVAAPTSTIDLSISNGDAIPIEERTPREVDHVGKKRITPDGVEVANPAFDVTPAKYITGIITEYGVAYPPYAKSLAEIIEQARAHRSKEKARA